MPIPVPPATCFFSAGPCQVWVNTGADGAMEFLGFSVNGISITENVFMTPIPSDENGGNEGPPADYQLMGRQDEISMELGKFNPLVLARLIVRANPGVNTSINPSVGLLLGCAGKMYRLCLVGCAPSDTNPRFIRNYPACVLPAPIQRTPVGSQIMRASVTFLANVQNGVLWNESVTGLPTS
jgi:hypothetical protein